MNAEPIRLAYFSNATVRGGVEEHILTLLKRLDPDRFRVTLICSDEVGRELRREAPSYVEIINLGYRNLRQPGGALRLYRFLRERKVQILHSHLFYGSLFASPVGWGARTPVVIETPHLREVWRHGLFKGSFFVDRRVSKFVDAYIAVSESNAIYLREVKGLPRERVYVIQNGTDVEKFQPSCTPSILKRAELGFAGDDLIALVPARLEPQKGHRVLLKALPQVLQRYPKLRVVLAGDGALRQQLEEETTTLGLTSAVRFVGRQSGMANWFEICDFSILPSFYEGLPLAAIESLAAGKPMVASAVDGTPEVIVDGRTGITVPPGDVQALAAAVSKMIGDQESRRTMGAAGRDWVLSRFTEKRQVGKTQDLYSELLDKALRKRLPRPARAAQLNRGSV